MEPLRSLPGRALRVLLASSFLSLACGYGRAATLTEAPFGTLADGSGVIRFTMTAANGVAVSFMSYGGAVTDVVAPGGRYGRYAGFTLETGHYPDSSNHPDFPSTVLRPGEVFTSTTVLRFGVQHGPDHIAPTIPAKGA